MLPTISSVTLLVAAPYTEVEIHTTEQQLDVQYALVVNNVKNPDGRSIDPTHNSKYFKGSNTPPTLVSATALDINHVDVLFSKAMLDEPILVATQNYIIEGPSIPEVSSAVLDADTVTVHLTLADNLVMGTYALMVINAPDAGYNLIDEDHNTVNFLYP